MHMYMIIQIHNQQGLKMATCHISLLHYTSRRGLLGVATRSSVALSRGLAGVPSRRRLTGVPCRWRLSGVPHGWRLAGVPRGWRLAGVRHRRLTRVGYWRLPGVGSGWSSVRRLAWHWRVKHSRDEAAIVCRLWYCYHNMQFPGSGTTKSIQKERESIELHIPTYKHCVQSNVTHI